MESAGHTNRVLCKQLGDEAMSYAMALLILPSLMETINTDKKEYKDFLEDA